MKVQDIQIDFLYFRFMSKEKPIKKGSIGSKSELDSKVHRIYARYISQIAIQAIAEKESSSDKEEIVR